MNHTELLVMIIFCIFFPPLAVAVKKRLHLHLYLNILLTILGWLPGMIHAFLVTFDIV